MKFARSAVLGVVVLSLSSLAGLSSALTTGAGRCVVGQASPAGFHVQMPQVNTGLLEDNGYIITINGQTVVSGQTATAVINEEFEIDITGPPFKGTLITVAGQDPSVIVPGPDTKYAETGQGCAGTASITHENSALKTTAFGIVTIPAPLQTTVELNIVVTNSGGVSTFYYTQVNLQVAQPVTLPVTAAPTAAPTASPVAIGNLPETEAPVAIGNLPETEAPVAIGNLPETEAPVAIGNLPETEAPVPPAVQLPETTVVDVVVENTDLNALEGAVLTAGLADALSGPDPVTVFAPNDAAFQEADADGLVTKYTTQPEWIAHLIYLLQYHVTAGAVMAADVMDGMEITTLAPLATPITAAVNETTVSFSGEVFMDSTVVEADLTADNGVVHIVDKVFIPPALVNSVLDTARLIPGAEQLPLLVEATGLVDTFTNEIITVFGPSADAFNAVPADITAAATADNALFKVVLENHVVQGIWPKALLEDGLKLTTLAGEELTVSVVGDVYKINGATIEGFDGVAANGIAHLIDTVLVPESLELPSTPMVTQAPVAAPPPPPTPDAMPPAPETPAPTPAPTPYDDPSGAAASGPAWSFLVGLSAMSVSTLLLL